MLIGVSVITTCLIFSVMVLILYFSKKRLNSVENRLYKVLIIINVLGLILELLCCYFTYNMNNSEIMHLLCLVFNRLFIIYLLTWMTIFLVYIIYITFTIDNHHETQKEYLKEIFVAIGTVYVVMIILALSLPLYYYHDENYVYSYGPAANLSVFCGTIVILTSIFVILKKRNSILSKQYLPLALLIVLLIVAVIIRLLNPGIILINSTLAFVTVLMYHTIENPDLKMIEELDRNRFIIEKNNQSNSNFIFNFTTESKQYINVINTIANEALQTNDKKYYETAFKNILQTTKEIEIKVNTIMDVSAMDIKNIKIANNKYSIIQILDEIRLQNEPKINDAIHFIVNISPNIPDKLYGDKIRVKQVISSLLSNAIKNTKEGFISLEVNTIIKYDICRIVLSVEDSGKGISLEKVNDILNFDEDINDEQINREDSLNMDLKTIKKVMKMLGGNLILTSKEEKGTKVTIVLDQKIATDETGGLEKKLANYAKKSGVQKILIVDDDLKELNDIQKYCKEQGIESVGTMYGNDCLERIRVGYNYDVIILDDSMNKINAIDILQELEKNKKFKTPVIVMLNEKKLSISKHYLDEGFADFIDKSRLDVEIKRIINEYLK